MSAAAVISWLLRHEVLVGWAAAVGGAVALMGGLYAFGHHAGVAAEKPKLEQARQAAAAATAQTGVAAAAAQAADVSAVRTVHIATKAEEAVHDVQAAPGADAPLDADLLSRWRTGLVGLRAEAAGADGASGDEPAQPVPAAGR